MYNFLINILITYIFIVIKKKKDVQKPEVIINKNEKEESKGLVNFNTILLCLLYNSYLICDWYPSEISLITLTCLYANIYHEVKNIYINFGVSL